MKTQNRSISTRVLVWILLLACGLACVPRIGAAMRLGPATAVATPLAFYIQDASAKLISVKPNGAEEFSFTFKLRNAELQPVFIVDQSVFLASEGGWSRSLPANWISNKVGSTTIPANSESTVSYQSPSAGERTAKHVIVRLTVAIKGLDIRKTVFSQIPIGNPSLPAPALLPYLSVDTPAYIGLQQPLETFTISTLKEWLQVAGQIVNLTKEAMTLNSYKITISYKQAGAPATSVVEMVTFGPRLIRRGPHHSSCLILFLFNLLLRSAPLAPFAGWIVRAISSMTDKFHLMTEHLLLTTKLWVRS